MPHRTTALLTLLAASCATAQGTGPSAPQETSAFSRSMAMEQQPRDVARDVSRRMLLQNPVDADQNVVVPIATSLRYTPSAERRRANLARFAERSRALDPAAGGALQSLFASTDIVAAIDARMRTIGLRADDVADAYALWWIVAWHAVEGRDSAPDAATARAVRAQAAAALLSSPAFTNATEAQKQEFAEALLIQAALVDAASDDARPTLADSQALADAVARDTLASGMDLSIMALTPEGFRTR